MFAAPFFGTQWVKHREIELIRTLLHVLKDVPTDVPRELQEINELLEIVLRNTDPDEDKVKVYNLVGLFFPELQNSNPVVRESARACIGVIAELSGLKPGELLSPHHDRIVKGIFTKPLRALPFPVQIGMIEAVRYFISLEPPVIALGDELLRLLHETLALADADDSQLMTRASARQSAAEIVKLRIACIKLLTASMPMTDFFSKQPQTRTR